MSDLVGNPEDGFSRITAHLIIFSGATREYEVLEQTRAADEGQSLQ